MASTSSFNLMNAGVLTTSAYTYDYGTWTGKYKNGDTFSIIAKMTVDDQAYKMRIGDFAITSATDNRGTDTFTWTSGTYGGLADTGTAGSWAAVPEPTSGLLLVLGMAGLALRRRRA